MVGSIFFLRMRLRFGDIEDALCVCAWFVDTYECFAVTFLTPRNISL